MSQAQEIFDQLCEPFDSSQIEWRIGSTTKDKSKGMALAYIDARTVMDRLDSVCGPGHWQCNYNSIGESVSCNLGILIGDAWIWKANGAGKTDFEAEKGMYSDAFKRAAVMFGIGRYLYDLDSPWVQLENEGRRISATELPKLNEIHEKHAQRSGWGTPGEVAIAKLLNRTVSLFVTDAATAQDFKEQNKGLLAQLRVGPRRLFLEKLDRIGASGHG